MSRRIFKCRMLFAYLFAGLAVTACHAEAPTFDATGNAPTNRMKLIGVWHVNSGDGTRIIARFASTGFLKVRLLGETKEAAFDVAGSILKITYKEKAGNAREETFKIKKLTEGALILDDKGADIEFTRKRAGP